MSIWMLLTWGSMIQSFIMIHSALNSSRIITDTIGLLIRFVIHTAEIQDRDGAYHVLKWFHVNKKGLRVRTY